MSDNATKTENVNTIYKLFTRDNIGFGLAIFQTIIAVISLYFRQKIACAIVFVFSFLVIFVIMQRFPSLPVRYHLGIGIICFLLFGSGFYFVAMPMVNDLRSNKQDVKYKTMEADVKNRLHMASIAYGEFIDKGSFETTGQKIKSGDGYIVKASEVLTGVRLKLYIYKRNNEYCLSKIEYQRSNKDDSSTFAYDTFTGNSDKLYVTRTIPLTKYEFDDFVITAEIDKAKRLAVKRRVFSKNGDIEFETYLFSGLLEERGMNKPLPFPKPLLPLTFSPYGG